MLEFVEPIKTLHVSNTASANVDHQTMNYNVGMAMGSSVKYSILYIRSNRRDNVNVDPHL